MKRLLPWIALLLPFGLSAQTLLAPGDYRVPQPPTPKPDTVVVVKTEVDTLYLPGPGGTPVFVLPYELGRCQDRTGTLRSRYVWETCRSGVPIDPYTGPFPTVPAPEPTPPPTDTTGGEPPAETPTVPGLAGTPEFIQQPNGVLAIWSAAPGAARYSTTGNGVAGVSVTVPERLLPAGFSDWFCVWPENDAGRATAQSCNAYVPPAPNPNPDPLPPPAAGVWWELQWPSPLTTGNGIAGITGTVATQTGTLIDGSQGRFIRATWTGGDTHGVDLSPPNAVTARPRELWLEVPIRFNGSSWGSTSDDKTLFVIPDYRFAGGDSEVWRWDLHLRGGAGPFFGGPYPQGGIPDWMTFDSSPRFVFDGQWHRLRLHYKMGSNETATDGAYEVWLDGTKVMNRVGIRTANPAAAFFRVIALGRNADPANGVSRDWGTLRVYTTNPGW